MTNPLIVRRASFQRALLDWYRTNARALPWRDRPSVYKTVVSELMLQQTQVKTVLPYFARWLAELPDFAALAAASEERVLKLWEGLGYYSRARNLHKLAKAVAAAPAMPRSPEQWRELPGVGPYTAAAITSISFGEPAACVDGNVVRILARLTANATEFADSASAAKVFSPLAQALIPDTTPGDHNQAMMELGATVCLRQKPLCLTCPVREFCTAAKRGDPENHPRLTPKKFEQRAVTRVWCLHENAVLLQRGAANARRLADLHELPTSESIGWDAQQIARSRLLATRKRSITRFQITESIHSVKFTPAQRRSLTGRPALHWIPVTELDRVTLSGPHRRWIAELLQIASAPSPTS
ncbi:MAG TPA: A/G-specific adenine glycosylase [Opitutaceae bacterium]|nr:A/G-specific adenine glycosylase [Opitutaceae bacterium]